MEATGDYAGRVIGRGCAGVDSDEVNDVDSGVFPVAGNRAERRDMMWYDILIVTGFFMMVLTPCVVALHASLAEEGPSLGYADSMRRLRAKVVDVLRV